MPDRENVQKKRNLVVPSNQFSHRCERRWLRSSRAKKDPASCRAGEKLVTLAVAAKFPRASLPGVGTQAHFLVKHPSRLKPQPGTQPHPAGPPLYLQQPHNRSCGLATLLGSFSCSDPPFFSPSSRLREGESRPLRALAPSTHLGHRASEGRRTGCIDDAPPREGTHGGYRPLQRHHALTPAILPPYLLRPGSRLGSLVRVQVRLSALRRFCSCQTD